MAMKRTVSISAMQRMMATVEASELVDRVYGENLPNPGRKSPYGNRKARRAAKKRKRK